MRSQEHAELKTEVEISLNYLVVREAVFSLIKVRRIMHIFSEIWCFCPGTGLHSFEVQQKIKMLQTSKLSSLRLICGLRDVKAFIIRILMFGTEAWSVLELLKFRRSTSSCDMFLSKNHCFEMVSLLILLLLSKL